MGPKRDVVGETGATAVRKQGLHFGASSHRAEHWFFFEGGMKFDSDVRDPRYLSFYGPAQPQRLPGAKHGTTSPIRPTWTTGWLVRRKSWTNTSPRSSGSTGGLKSPPGSRICKKFAAYYYNRAAEWKRGVAINYKHEAFPAQTAVLDIERGKLDQTRPLFWQTDTSVSIKSWGYIEKDEFRSATSLVDDLADIVSKNGCLLLNIGPRSDGTIPEQAQKILLEIGRWLSVNGEAIYGTRPWKIYGEGPTKVVGGSFKDTASKPFTSEDIRFTTKGNTLYAIALAWPQNGKLTIKSLAGGSPQSNGDVKRVELLGSKTKLNWTRDAKGLTVVLPAEKPGDYAFALKISAQ